MIDELETFSSCAQEYVAQHESERLKALKSALATLSEAEQTVLRATMFHFQAGQEHQRMPHGAVKSLCDELSISPENLRKIRSRAMAKLKASILKQVEV